MPATTMAENLSPKLLKVMQRAKRDPQGPLRSLAHLIDEQALRRAYGRLPALKTRKASLRRAMSYLAEWCRSHRHLPVQEQHAALCRRISGHGNYFAVNGNLHSVRRVDWYARRVWRKWLSRRGSPKPLSWSRFLDILRDYPLPTVRVRVQLWQSA